MDGSVSTLAPVFAAAFATKNSHEAFLVGLAASAGAGISMGFAEALSDDGSLTGRGHPWVRGLVCGAMTAVGGIGHTLPFMLRDFRMALWAAGFVVVAELGVITWIRHRYMDSPWISAALQVGLGGVLVFITGLLIGSLIQSARIISNRQSAIGLRLGIQRVLCLFVEFVLQLQACFVGFH